MMITQSHPFLSLQAVAPNLTTMVGELVGARLIAHAGSLINLAKHPASTVQILGAEKALFRCDACMCVECVWVHRCMDTWCVRATSL